jgi:cysteinyl-tRNA synthetase
MENLTSLVSVQVDTHDKEMANDILKTLGLNMSTYVNMAIKQLLYTNGLPFEVKTPNNIVDDNNYSEDDFNKYNDLFKEALSDNLNTSNALTVLYDVLKSEISNKTKLELVKSFDKVLSLDLIKQVKVSEELKNKVNELLALRNKYKQEKDYEKADEVRKEIESLGASIKDTREGSIIIWN